MGKVIIRHNFRIKVYPRDSAYGLSLIDTEEEYKKACQEIVSDIKRHVYGIGPIEIVWDTTEECSFCHYNWEVDPVTGEPQCCEDAIEEWKTQKTT